MISHVRTLVAATMLACLGMQKAQPDSIQFKQYVSHHKKYSLEFPADWVVGPGQEGFGPFWETPAAAHNKSRNLTISILCEKEAPDTTLDSYSKNMIRIVLPRWYHGFQIVSERDFQAGKIRGRELIYSYQPQDRARVQIIRFYFVSRGRLCEIGTIFFSQDDLKQQQTLVETIAASFKFTH